MEHSIKTIADCKVEAICNVDKDVWADAQKKALEKEASKINLKGFRPGKAPLSLVKSHINQANVYDTAINDLLQTVYGQLLNETGIKPFNRPEVNVTKLSETELEIKFSITTIPEVTLGQYKGFSAPKPTASVSEEEVNAEVKKMLQGAASLVSVDREAKMGDTVVIDFKGFVDGEAFEGGEAENYSLELGSHYFVPGFEEALVGVKSGDKKDVVVTFPTQYVASLAGKEATFKCKVHEVKEKSVPALSDEAAKDCGINGVETADQLKDYCKNSILNQRVNAVENGYYNAILGQIVAAASFKFAPEVLEQETDNIVDQTRRQVEQQGLTFEQYLEITGATVDSLRANAKVQAENNLKGFLVTSQIAVEENLRVTNEDIDAEMNNLANMYGMKLEDVRNALSQNLDNFANQLQSKKIHDFIVANSSVTTEASKPAEEAKAE